MNIPDPIKVIGFFLPIPVLFAVGGQYIWMWFFLGVGGLLAGVELYSYKTTDKSISQRFWEWKDNKKKKSVIGAMLLFWAYLIAHLLWKW
jgi:hypothetical protein